MKIFQKRNSQQLKKKLNSKLRGYYSNFKNLNDSRVSESRIKNLSNLKILKVIRGNLQALWYVIFTSVYVWCIFWVCYDLFVWNKTIFEVNIFTFAGSVMSILLLWAGTFIWKNDRTKKQTYNIEYPYKQKPTSILMQTEQQNQQPQTKTTSYPHTQIVTPNTTQTEQQNQQPQTKTTESKCIHYCGYLKNRDKSEEIPEKCLICKKLIQCS